MNTCIRQRQTELTARIQCPFRTSSTEEQALIHGKVILGLQLSHDLS